MDEPWGPYAKWNKPVIKRQTLYDFTYMRYPEKSNSERQTMAWWVPGAGGEGNEEWLFNGYRISVFQDKKRSGVAYTIMWMYLTSVNCTLKKD